MKKFCKARGKEYSFIEKNMAYDNELCSMRCEAKFQKPFCHKGNGDGGRR